MLYRTMPRDTESLSILGFGCMRLPTTTEGKIDRPQALEMLRTAYDNGVNYFDTAVPYHKGESEEFVGEFLRTIDRSKVFVATKLPCWLIKTHEDMHTQLDAQLQRLGTDYIDYYLLHALNRNSWKNLVDNDVFTFIQAALASGKIRKIGFSFHDDFKIFRKIVDAYNWDFCQIQLNYMDIQEQAGLRGLRYAAGKGMGIVVMEPLKGGKLAANVPDDIAKAWSKSHLSLTPAQRALRWVWDLPQVTLLLSGMSDMAQVKDNLATASTALPQSLDAFEQRIYATVRRLYRKKLPLHCTGCRYCLPCPHKVAIPFCFGVYMEAHLFGDKARHQKEYQWFVPEEGRADKCASCNACLSKCPQKIDIPSRLREVKAYFS